MKYVSIVVALGLFLSATAQAFDADKNCTPPDGLGVRQCLNLTNINENDSAAVLTWHLYLPPNWSPTSPKYPTLIWVHGGGWAKVFSTEFAKNKIEPNELKFLLDMAAKGFVVASSDYNAIDYNPAFSYATGTPAKLKSPEVNPAPPNEERYIGRAKIINGRTNYYGLTDVSDFADAGFKAAIAEDLRIDTGNVSIGGSSAGAYMALFEATKGRNNYNCVIAASAPSDLEKYVPATTNPTPNYDQDFLHGIGIINTAFCSNCKGDFKTRLAAINPGNSARLAMLKAQKMFILHGVYDNYVPVSQAINLAKRVRASFPAIAVKEWYDIYPANYPNAYRDTSSFSMPKTANHAIDFASAYAKLSAWVPDCKTTTNPPPTPICGEIRETCEAGTFSKLANGTTGANWMCGSLVCRARFRYMTSAESDASLPGWPASAVIDDNPNTGWSSPVSDRTNSQGHVIIAWGNKSGWNNPTNDIKPQSVFEVVMKARMLNGRPLAFPKSYKIHTTDWLGARVKLLGTYSTQPDVNGNVIIPIENAPIQVFGVKIEPTELGTDDYNNYYFQLVELGIR
jgi:acetyl esterase/lipase